MRLRAGACAERPIDATSCLPVAARSPAALLLFGVLRLVRRRRARSRPGRSLFKGAFGDWFSWQNTLQRAAPLMLTALCVALPARAGLIVIGGEGALVLGGLACAGAAVCAAAARRRRRHARCVLLAGAAGRRAPGSRWPAALRQYRGVNETISQPAARLHRDRAVQALRRRAAARPGEPEQAVDARARRERCASAASPAPTCTGAWCSASSPASALGALAALHAARLRGARGRRQPARGAAASACRRAG